MANRSVARPSVNQLDRETAKAADIFKLKLAKLNDRRKEAGMGPLSYDMYLNVDGSKLSTRERKILGAVLDNYEARNRKR